MAPTDGANGAATRSATSASTRSRGHRCASTARSWSADVARPGVSRVCVLVCDSWGVGDAPDADGYGDGDANTLAHVSHAVGGLDTPALGALGLGLLTAIEGVVPRAEPGTAHGRATEVSAGKDTTTGHWEMMGVLLDTPFPLYPNGFPDEVIGPFSSAIEHRVLGNVPASGTEIVAELGEAHLATGDPIVYTSGDSVFQIAAHVDVVPLERLYTWCDIARGLLAGPHRVGRVIARPFDGTPGSFVRRPERRDYSGAPPRPTPPDHLLPPRRTLPRSGGTTASPHPDPPRSIISSPPEDPSSGSARSKTSSTTAACPTRSTPLRTTTGSTERSPRSAMRRTTWCSRTSSTSIPSTGTATTPRATPPRSRRSTAACPRFATRSATASSWSPATTAAIRPPPRPIIRANACRCSSPDARAVRTTSARGRRSPTSARRCSRRSM